MSDIDESVRVELRDLPVDPFRRMLDHHDELLRELTLVAVGDGASALPSRLLRLAGDLASRHEDLRERFVEQVDAASRGGQSRVTVSVELPPESVQVALDLIGAFEELDRQSRAGALLALATPPEVAALRRDIGRQLRAELDSTR